MSLSFSGQLSNYITAPTQIPGLQIWLDSSSSNYFTLSNTSNVLQWNDRSGNGFHFSNVQGAPTYIGGSRGVFFSSARTDLMRSISSNITYSANVTNVFAVGMFSNPGGSAFYMINFGCNTDASFRYGGGGGTVTNANDIYYNIAGQILNINGTPFLITPPANSVNLYNVFSFVIGANALIYSPSYIQLSSAFTNRYLTGFINEVIFYSNALTVAQRQQVEGYLTWKWGLSGSIAQGHPFQYQSNFPGYGVLQQIPANVNTQFTTLSNYITSPTQISGLQLWLDAADSTTVLNPGTSNMVWNDKSGNGFNAIPVSGALYPSYSNSNINITNGSYLSGSLNIASNTLLTTGFCVAITPSSYSGTNRLLSAADGLGNDYSSPSGFAYSAFASNSGGVGYAYRSLGNSTIGNIPVSTRFMSTTLYSSNGVFIFSFNGNYPNGASTYYASTSNSANTNKLIKYNIGAVNTGGLNYGGQTWNGSVNEILIFNRTLSQTEYQQVEGYLAWKWGLAGSITQGHPFKYQSNFPGYGAVKQIPAVAPQLTFSPSIWAPTQIPTLALWLDAADSTTIGTSNSVVTSWNDKSGLGRNVSNIVGNPTYASSNKYINMSGGAYFRGPITINNAIGTPNITGFCVVTTPSIYPANTHILSVMDSGNYQDYAAPNGFLICGSTGCNIYTTRGPTYNAIVPTITSSNTTILTTTVTSTNNPYYISINGNYPTGSSLYWGSNIRNDSTSQNIASQYLISVGFNNGIIQSAWEWNGYVQEFIIYNSTLSISQIQQVEGYLAWKWGLTGYLPSTHNSRWVPP